MGGARDGNHAGAVQPEQLPDLVPGSRRRLRFRTTAPPARFRTRQRPPTTRHQQRGSGTASTGRRYGGALIRRLRPNLSRRIRATLENVMPGRSVDDHFRGERPSASFVSPSARRPLPDAVRSGLPSVRRGMTRGCAVARIPGRLRKSHARLKAEDQHCQHADQADVPNADAHLPPNGRRARA